MTSRSAEVVVVGGGVIGLAAARALRNAGADVVCLERGTPGSGQSAGLTRVFRHIHDDLALVTAAKESRALWDAWGDEAGVRLLGEEGVLFAAPDVEPLADLLAAAGVEHRLVGEPEQRDLLPALAPPSERALFDPGGGGIRVRPAIDFLAHSLGGRLVREEVLALRPDGDGVAAYTPEGIWRCDRVLVCAGVRTPDFARPLGFDLPVELALHVRVTYAIREASVGRTHACWYDRTGRFGPGVYAGPIGDDLYAVGVGTEDQLGGDTGEAASRRYVEQALPGLDPSPVAHRPCWLTILPWHADAAAVWAAGPVFLFAGHNLFKFAPLLGEQLAEVARTGEVLPELTPPG